MSLLCNEGCATGRVKVILPKSYMATLSFVLGYWAKGITEFSELDIHKFMVEPWRHRQGI